MKSSPTVQLKAEKYQLTNKLYSRSQIRAELFRLGNSIRNMRNAHLVACGLDHPCHVCDRIAGEISGINDAIRHFGGRTQLIVPGARTR